MTEAETPSLTKQLAGEHRDLDALLASAKSATARGDIERACTTFAAFRAGLERHIEAEEQILFPAFERVREDAARGPISVLRREHDELRKLMHEVAAALGGAGSAGLTALLAALTARIYVHNGKEERILYPAADRTLAEAGTRDALLRRWRSFGCPR